MHKQRILIVDDTPANITVLNNLLRDQYQIIAANNGPSALKIARSENQPDLILLDIMMPGMDGYEVIKSLTEDSATKNIPVLFITAKVEEEDELLGLSLGAVDYITKPFSPPTVKLRVKNQLELKRYQDHLNELVIERTREVELTQEVAIYSLACLAETRDPETGAHILRTQRYVKALALELKRNSLYSNYLDDSTIDMLYRSAPLHDIGKVGVEDKILLKPGKLTEQEFVEMKKHTVYGNDTLRSAEKMLGDNSFIRLAREIAYTHHEKWDGSGYPDGISGDDIPVSGRLMAIADVYDALINKRVYKPPFSHREAVSIILEGRGTHFDPDMIDAFLSIEKEFRQIALEFEDSEEEKEAIQ